MTANARYTEVGDDSMSRMKFTFENTDEGSSARALLETLIALRTKRGVVYTTTVFSGGIEFILVTTSRDIQLGIASMGENSRAAFCQLIDDELEALNRPGLIFLPPMNEHEEQRAMHVMRVDDARKEGRVFLNLARAG